MRRASLVRLVAVAVGWLLLLVPSAAAFPAEGPCSLTLISYDAQGDVLDSVESGDDSASADDPFLADWDGLIGWRALVAAPFQDYHFEVDMFGIPTPLRGGSANTSDTRSSTGAFAFTGSPAFRFTGTYYLSARVAGSGADCEGNLVVKLVGDPVGTIPFFVGLSLIAIAILLAAWGLKGHLLAGVFGGAFAGLGLAITLTIYSILPFGGLTPVTVVIAGLMLGIVAAGAGRIRLVVTGGGVASDTAAPPEVADEPADGPPEPVPTAPVGTDAGAPPAAAHPGVPAPPPVAAPPAPVQRAVPSSPAPSVTPPANGPDAPGPPAGERESGSGAGPA